MRSGFTTGSCAAAASKAAAQMLLFGERVENIRITTPKGTVFNADIVDITMSRDFVSCGVIKDGGDDPDVTTGAHIMATACLSEERTNNPGVVIKGGEGVGRVTKPGLDRPVGDYAINTTPRRMITQAVMDVMENYLPDRDIIITISVPEGLELAEKTFNPRLGIEGGISIIGTSGIVEPMSTRAIIDTINVEIKQKKALGFDCLRITPGNYGREFLLKEYKYDINDSVKCSNFIGETVDLAVKAGFKNLLITGHIGKLIKVAGGIMNTHSREADCRMEILSSLGILCGLKAERAVEILGCLTTEEALLILENEGILVPVMERMLEKILFYLDKRAGGYLNIDCIVYSNDRGLLAKSKGAVKWLIS